MTRPPPPHPSYHPTFSVGSQPYTSPVGYFAPNGYGLYDMAGNVWEWCWDTYQSDYYASSPASDPRGPVEDTSGSQVMRGGMWNNYADGLRVASRWQAMPTITGNILGFRCARGL